VAGQGTTGLEPRGHRRLRRIEWVAWAVAALLGGCWLTARGLAWSSERRTLAAFYAAERAASAVASPVESPAPPASDPVPELGMPPLGVDQSLWSVERIRAYARALARPAPPPMAVLRIRRLALEVPVLEGTDEWTLDRGVGHIEDTARPGETGNVGIAGHRDGFFRVLKDIQPGDVLELALPGSVRRYHVEKLSVVRPEDVRVLEPTPGPRLTLVTCYPFYFAGPAPERFIVQARLE